MYDSDPVCFRCGQVGHLRAQCPQARPVPAADSAKAPSAVTPLPPPAWTFRRPAEDICGPTPEYLAARERLHGVPDWLARRMIACQQVADSRRTRNAHLDNLAITGNN